MLLSTHAQRSGFLLNTQQDFFQEKREKKEPVQVRCLQKCSARLYLRIEAKTLKDTQGEVEAEALLYALTNTLAEIRAEIILRQSGC